MGAQEGISGARSRSVLILGVYLGDKENNVDRIVQGFSTPSSWHVVQKWVAIGNKAQSEKTKNVTIASLQDPLPKFVLLNRILAQEELDNYDFVLICDDDIALPEGFLSRYLDLVVQYDFALAQPARTHNSYIDWHFVRRLDGVIARCTRYVEIGPLFSVRHDIFSMLFPFDESSYMGWGYGFVWPCLLEKHGHRMGIIDATPVEHCMRKPVKHYDYDKANQSMQDYLLRNRHLSKGDAFRILESYAER